MCIFQDQLRKLGPQTLVSKEIQIAGLVAICNTYKGIFELFFFLFEFVFYKSPDAGL